MYSGPSLDSLYLYFFDGILVYSKNQEVHLSHLETAFAILQDNMLFAKLTKCHFACTSFEYLGYIIS